MDNLIRIYGDVISSEKCQYFVDKFEAHPEMHEVQVTRYNEDEKTMLTRLNLLKKVDTPFKEDSKFLGNLFRENVERYIGDCRIKSFQLPKEFGFESFVIKRYLPDTGEEFPPHVDVSGAEYGKRFLVMLMYLTDNEAGQTELEVLGHDNLGFEFGSSPCQKGNMLMFPPYWPWTHAGKVPTKKPKYTLGTYCQYTKEKQNMPYIGRAPSASITKLEDADQDTKIQVEESSDEDIIRFDIAGAEDFTMSANAFNVLSGSTLNINSGATIANSGTDTGFGADAERAVAGVLQTNANFVDQVIFGPAVDGRAWNGLWNKASVFSSLMLATIEDEGSNTEINIWDLTEQSGGTISTTPLATVDLASAATPTAIAACMGYLIVSSEDGIAIIDPHSGAWAERTVGWPRTLSSSTTPALTNNDVQRVAAGLSDQPPYDPRTGGPLPSFALVYGTGVDETALIKDDGNVWQYVGSVGMKAIGISNGYVIISKNTQGDGLFVSNRPISGLNNDDFGGTNVLHNDDFPYALGIENGMDVSGSLLAGADPDGLSFAQIKFGDTTKSATSAINRTYNTGYMVGDIRGAWLANSSTVDRSYKANTLTANGSITAAAVASGAELQGYSGFSSSNNLTRASDADYDVLGTAAAYSSIWFKSSGNSATEYLYSISNSAGTLKFVISLVSDGTVQFRDDGATALVDMTSTATYDNGVWHKADFVRVSSTERYMYVDGVLITSSTTDAGSLSSSGNIPIGIGVDADGGSAPATSTTLSLARLSATAPTANQIRQMYDDEKGMFVASAECLLQSGSTDAVIDVDVDPLTNKVLVTQTDAITIFDGLVVDSKPTVNSGNSEKGKLWGALRAEQNSANAFITAPAVDQRQVNEMVRGLASNLPKGLDLGKAKGWVLFNGTGTLAILQSYNCRGVTDHGVGNYGPQLALGFKDRVNYMPLGSASREGGVANMCDFVPANNSVEGAGYYSQVLTKRLTDNAGIDASMVFVAWFGELENE